MSEALTISFLTTTAHVVLGTAVWRNQPRQPANQWFAFLSLTLAAWTLSNGLVNAYGGTASGIIWARSAFATASLMPLCFFFFVSEFPSATPRVSVQLRRIIAMSALAIFAISFTPLIAKSTTSLNGALQVTYGPLHPVFGLYLVGTLVYSLTLLARKLRVLTGFQRLQVRYVFLGVALTAAGGVITNLVLPLVFQTSRYSVYGPAFGVLLLVLVGHAILRYRLLNIRLVVRRGVTEVAAFAIAALAFMILAWCASAFMSLEPRTLPLWVTLILVLLIAQVLQPLRKSVQTGLDYYFFRDPYNYQNALREISRTIGDLIELPAVFEYTCRAIGETIRAEAVTIYARDTGGAEFRLQALWYEGDAPPRETVSATSALVRWLNAERDVLLAAEVPRARPVDDRAAVADLRGRGGECAVPLMSQGQLTGLLLVGPRRSGDLYLAEDIDLLRTIASQVSIAIGNARLYAKVVLAEAEKRRVERLASIGSLASGIAHEIKNPLVAIRTFAELLPERSGDEEFQGAFADIVLREVERIDQLVARLRGLAAGSGGHFAAVDLREPLQETLALLRGQIERGDIRLAVTFDDQTPLVHGDPSQLKQLFLNVLMNALEATERGGHLAVRLAYTPGTGRVIVEIDDTGSGVPMDLVPQIFDPFVTTKPHGSGLGLTISRAIADAHHATIRLDNNPRGRGARVALDFPALATPAPTSVIRGPNVPEPTEQTRG